MRRETKIIAVLTAVGVLGGVFAFLYPILIATETSGEVRGVLTYVDPATRRASLECQHPRTGRRIEPHAVVPADCPITINGQPARFADLKVEDRAVVRAVWNAQRKEVRPLSITVTRPPTAVSDAGEPDARPVTP